LDRKTVGIRHVLQRNHNTHFPPASPPLNPAPTPAEKENKKRAAYTQPVEMKIRPRCRCPTRILTTTFVDGNCSFLPRAAALYLSTGSGSFNIRRPKPPVCYFAVLFV
jgi:hypothetical protein